RSYVYGSGDGFGFLSQAASAEFYSRALHGRSSDLPSPTPATAPTRRPRPSAVRSGTSPAPRRTGGRRSRLARSASTSARATSARSEEHTSELQSRENLVCRLLLA